MKKELYLTHRPLADMHGDGVRFTEQLLKKAKQHPQMRNELNRYPEK